MPALHSSTQEYNGAFVIGADELTKIAEIAQELLGEEANISIHLEGLDSISSKEIGQLLGDTLLYAREIRSISISGHCIHPSSKDFRRVEVSLSTSRHSRPISVQMSGPTAAVISARESINNVIDGAKTWYRLFAMKTGILSGMIYALVGYAVVVAVSAELLSKISKINQNNVGPFMVSMVVLTFMIGSARLRLFPGLQFSIGKSGRTLATRNAMRNWIISFVVVTLIGGVAANYIFQYLTSGQ